LFNDTQGIPRVNQSGIYPEFEKTVFKFTLTGKFKEEKSENDRQLFSTTVDMCKFQNGGGNFFVNFFLKQIKDTNIGFFCPRPAGFYFVNNLVPPKADIIPRFVLLAAKYISYWEATVVFKAKTKNSKMTIVITINFQGEIVPDD
jgi:Protein of unknown function (DUF1091)